MFRVHGIACIFIKWLSLKNIYSFIYYRWSFGVVLYEICTIGEKWNKLLTYAPSIKIYLRNREFCCNRCGPIPGYYWQGNTTASRNRIPYVTATSRGHWIVSSNKWDKKKAVIWETKVSNNPIKKCFHGIKGTCHRHIIIGRRPFNSIWSADDLLFLIFDRRYPWLVLIFFVSEKN